MGLYPTRARSIPHRGQATRLRIARFDRPDIGSALDHRGDIVSSDGQVTIIVTGVSSGPQTVFQVRHDPGARARTVAPIGGISKIDGFHGAVAIVIVGLLGVAVVEAASTVVVRAVEDRVLALGIVAGRDARGGVVAVPDARSDVDAVDLVTGDRH